VVGIKKIKLFFAKLLKKRDVNIYYQRVAQILLFSEKSLEKVKKYAIIVYC